jgi:epoxyqueuosine reductase QueG
MNKSANSNLTEKIKKFSSSIGADLVGITSSRGLRNAPKGHKPTDLLSSAQSVIVCAKSMPHSVILNGPDVSYHNIMRLLENQLDNIAYEICLYIEKYGGSAIPIPSDKPYSDWNPKNHHGMDELSHKHAAQAAGIGRMGKNSLLITLEYGNRVQLVSVITNLDLEHDLSIDDDICPEDCTLCIDACPVHAISDNQEVNQKLCRSNM